MAQLTGEGNTVVSGAYTCQWSGGKSALTWLAVWLS